MKRRNAGSTKRACVQAALSHICAGGARKSSRSLVEFRSRTVRPNGFCATASLFGIPIPSELINSLPFILTVVMLAGFVGAANPPKAAGVAYVKER